MSELWTAAEWHLGNIYAEIDEGPWACVRRKVLERSWGWQAQRDGGQYEVGTASTAGAAREAAEAFLRGEKR
jgi:hypothetical protein